MIEVDQFAEWLQGELDKRNWLASDLIKRAGLGSGTLSHIMNGYRKPGPDLCRAIAATLNLPEETVFRRAGLLSPKPENSKADAAKGLLDLLNDQELDYVVEFIEWRLSRQTEEQPTDEEKEKARLFEKVAQMSPEQREAEIKNLLSRAKILEQAHQAQNKTG